MRRARPDRRNCRAVACLAALALAGCGAPSITAAGNAGMQIPYDDPLATSAQALAAPSTTVPSPRQSTVAGRSSTREAASVAPTSSGARTRQLAAQPSAAAPSGRANLASAPTGASSTTLALPAPGGYSYALSGSSSVGPLPATMRLTVADGAGPGAQLWTMDARRSDGSGLVEEFTLARGPDGIYLRTYRLDASTGTAGIVLDFAPTTPVLFEPDRAQAGRSSEFDMTSSDGCTQAHSTVTIVAAGDRSTLRHLRMDSTLRTTGPVSCIAVSGERVEDLYHSGSAVLPSRIDSELHGTLAGFPAQAKSSAVAAGGAAEVALSAFE
ncbi:MAG TPA: hypothetical protein VHU88_01560 [Sporichthyaceae bacterium]|nr:hypothetical protein [Sporichthyaceae bacterium]